MLRRIFADLFGYLGVCGPIKTDPPIKSSNGFFFFFRFTNIKMLKNYTLQEASCRRHIGKTNYFLIHHL
jgi:hypothetical protein